MVGRKQNQYTPEFRAAAVKEVIDRSRPGADVARELGINSNTLWSWVRTYREKHSTAPDNTNGSGADSVRVKELEKQVRDLRMENEFLAKSVAFFAKKLR